jgi:hypothetical protein
VTVLRLAACAAVACFVGHNRKEGCHTKRNSRESCTYWVYSQGVRGDFNEIEGVAEGDQALVLLLERYVLSTGRSFLVHAQSMQDRQKELELMAKNIETKVQGDKLVITIDLSKNFGLSSSGKSLIIATSEGNVPVSGREDIKIGVNVYRPQTK